MQVHLRGDTSAGNEAAVAVSAWSWFRVVITQVECMPTRPFSWPAS